MMNQQDADKLFYRLQGGAQIYFCMMLGIVEALEQLAISGGIECSTFLKKQLQANDQRHIQV
jgi:hypothetical protein